MTDYLKTAKDKVSAIGGQLAQKAKEIGEAISKGASGAGGALGDAKGALKSRQSKIDQAVDDAMANGGVVGKKRPQRG